MARQDKFSTIKLEGTLLTMDQLKRILNNDAEGISPEQYGLVPGEKINEVISRDWDKALKIWQSFQNNLESLAEDDPANVLTRDRWLLPLFNLLGYGRLQPAKGLQVESVSYPISHIFASTPIHMLGCRVRLDHRTSGQRGAARISPHGLVQEYLNKNINSLWGIVTNGYILRLLRDNANIARMTYLEFNLIAMMDTQAYSDFVLFWMLIHSSRFEIKEGGPERSIIELWSKNAQDNGVRALDELRGGVESALRTLGNGFLSHPNNQALVIKVQTNQLSAKFFLEQLMHLIYRLIFLFVAEDRDLLLLPLNSNTAEARKRYETYYSTANLRQQARRSRSSRHTDQWERLKVVMGLLDAGYDRLALPALGSFLWSDRAIVDLLSASLTNEHLYCAFRQLCWTQTTDRSLMAVDWKNLGSEELGSIYESLLELVPSLHVGADIPFELINQAGNERKTTGSYYTHSSLIMSLIETTLIPIINQAIQNKSTERAKEALLNLKVCDPSCGSGHFLVAAAHRIARQLAILETGDDEPAPDILHSSLRRVISRCIYGVDLNPMSVELCKVALWMESMEQGKPLSFLDHHIKCGNSLLGATPKLIQNGIPDDAFSPLTGDDKAFSKALKKTNREYRIKYDQKQQSFFTAIEFGVTTDDWRKMYDYLDKVNQNDEETIDDVKKVESNYFSLIDSSNWKQAKLIADAWCSSFTQYKIRENTNIIDEIKFTSIRSNPTRATESLMKEVETQATSYKFFHWYLEFVDVFKPNATNQDTIQGWSGGFDVILGNPPWDKVKMEEVPWFSQFDASIASAGTASQRKVMISKLQESNPQLFAVFQAEKRIYEARSDFLHNSGRFPLAAVGDVNTYMVFSELNRQIVSPNGRAGFIVPSGIATDKGSSAFFGDLANKGEIVSLYAFENRLKLFPIDSRQRYCLLTLTGSAVPINKADYAFFLDKAEDLKEEDRHFSMSGDELRLFNPNTSNCPTFRRKRDKEIAENIYQRIPTLWKEARDGQFEDNPWGIQYKSMFHMSNDSNLFWTKEKLIEKGWTQVSNHWYKNNQWMVPLYEGKMFFLFDHRYATYENATEAQINSGQLPKLSNEDHVNPFKFPMPTFWVDKSELDRVLDSDVISMICLRDITNATNQRTGIFTIYPHAAFANTAPAILVDKSNNRYIHLLSAFLSSYSIDWISRISVGGTHMNFYILNQIPAIRLETIQSEEFKSLYDLFNEVCLELYYTSWDLYEWAINSGFNHGPYHWNSSRRFELNCILNAIVSIYCGLSIDDLTYILNTFDSILAEEISLFGEFRTLKHIILYINEINDNRGMDPENLKKHILLRIPNNSEKFAESDINELKVKMPWINWSDLINSNSNEIVQKVDFSKESPKNVALDIATLLINNGFTVIDNRPKGGFIWVIYEPAKKELIAKILKDEYSLHFAEYGGKATNHKAAWWIKPK